MANKISNTAGNRQLYRQAYLIEFYESDLINPKETFTFSLPPESEEISYSQRKTETKTFGGLHVTEYGTDAAKITLSGSTVNQELKRIYRGKGNGKWLSGEDEIYFFRSLILRYRSLENLQKRARGRILIYDLSKITGTHNEQNEDNNILSNVRIANCWVSFPGDFKIRRSNDQPFTYKYTFEFTGVPYEYMAERFETQEPDLNALELVKDNLNQLYELTTGEAGSLQGHTDNTDSTGNIGNLDQLHESVRGGIGSLQGHTANLNRNIRRLSTLLAMPERILTMAMSDTGRMAASILGNAAGAARNARSAVELPRTVQLRALNIYLEIQNAANSLMRETVNLVEAGLNLVSAETYRIPPAIKKRLNINNAEFLDMFRITANRLENAACELCAAVKSSSMPDIFVGEPDPQTGRARVFTTYGSKPVMLKSTDSMESLALEHLGDPGRAIDIAMFNGIASLDDLTPGDIIKIPVTERSARQAANRIYARREDLDNYGRDILLTDEGRIAVLHSGDYALASGTQNLSQAVLLRLRENVAKRIRLNAYGIRANIADPVIGRAYVASSVELTVSSDPRVASVDSISFRGERDILYVDVAYTDINNNIGRIAGAV